MILMLTDCRGDHVLINSEHISRAFRARNTPSNVHETAVILRERSRTHTRSEGMITSQVETKEVDEIAVTVQETVEEIFGMLSPTKTHTL